jgi:hypothetical protein
MKILRLSLSALTLTVAAGAFAADPSHTALDTVSITASNRLVVECATEKRPSLRAVADVLGTNNGSRLYAERERLVHLAHRECMRGAGYVAFVRDGSGPAPALAVVDAPARP